MTMGFALLIRVTVIDKRSLGIFDGRYLIWLLRREKEGKKLMKKKKMYRERKRDADTYVHAEERERKGRNDVIRDPA